MVVQPILKSKPNGSKALEYVCQHIFEDDDNAISNVLDKFCYKETQCLMSASDSMIKALPLAIFDISMIRNFQQYIMHLKCNGKPFNTLDDWKSLDIDSFNNYRLSQPPPPMASQPIADIFYNEAATVIQSSFRGFKTRNIYKQLQ